jgi:hypothetical protein
LSSLWRSAIACASNSASLSSERALTRANRAASSVDGPPSSCLGSGRIRFSIIIRCLGGVDGTRGVGKCSVGASASEEMDGDCDGIGGALETIGAREGALGGDAASERPRKGGVLASAWNVGGPARTGGRSSESLK